MIRTLARLASPFAALALVVATHAQEAASSSAQDGVNKERIEAALKLTQGEAAKYVFVLANDARSMPALREEPVLKWSDPSVGEIHGNVFLWTLGERPAVVGSLFKWFEPHTHMSHEFHSLSEASLTGKYAGSEVWRTKAPGVTFATMPEADRPAATSTRRFLQMRELAKGFSATKTERNGNQTQLRLLPQPAFRYASAKDGILDGGLFVLVQGTDPEVFVLLEARGAGDKAQWMFAATRMNSVGFELRYRDKPAWAVEIMPWSDVSSHAETYTSFMFKMP